MQDIVAKIACINWEETAECMHDKGFALIPGFLNDEQCESLKTDYSRTDGFRKTVVMERYRFGQGEYKYYDYPLPQIIQSIREQMYGKLAPIANDWMKALNITTQYPGTFQELKDLCHANNQTLPTALILKYGKGGHNTLHQDLYGAVYFPIQIVLFLNEPEKDYTGGEFVLTEQVPRAQSKAIVLNPKKGDLLIFTTNFRPVKGSKGFHKVNMKHGVSIVHSGERHTLGIIFHDALS
jgi:hypothetical protein